LSVVNELMGRIQAVGGGLGIILVGGQALALWARHYSVDLPERLMEGVTRDIDYLADQDAVVQIAAAIGVKPFIPSLDDYTPNSGKIVIKADDGSQIDVDFLSFIMGVDDRLIHENAVALDFNGQSISLIHPVLLMESRLFNQQLPGKQTPQGIAQIDLSVRVVNAFLRDLIATEGERAAFRQVERIGDRASTDLSARVYLKHGIRLLDAVPVDAFSHEEFLAVRWPQIEDEFKRKVASIQRLYGRVAGPGKGFRP